jgi:polyisoprenoid-binding protein YceI
MTIRAAAAVLFLASTAHAQRYAIRPAEASRLELRVAKTGLYKGKVHVFSFPRYEGTLNYDAARPEASQIILTLTAGAIKLMDTWLSPKDFKSVQEYALKDMLAAGKYPDITFASSQIRAVDATHFEVRGLLTIRGMAKPSTVSVSLQPGAGESLRFQGNAIIRLTDYGLKPPTAALGLVGTKDEMEFSFTLTLAGGPEN